MFGPFVHKQRCIFLCIDECIHIYLCRSVLSSKATILAQTSKANTHSTQIHLIDMTVTKNSVARAIMLAMTQLYSLHIYYFQNLNLARPEQERGGGRSG